MFLVHTTDGKNIIIDEEINVLKRKFHKILLCQRITSHRFQRSGVSVEILLKYAHPP